MSHLGSLWGGTSGVTFESLLGHFNSFCVSVQLGGRSLHKMTPIFRGPETGWPKSRNTQSQRGHASRFQAVLDGVRLKLRKGALDALTQGSGAPGKVNRRPPDYSSNLCPPKTFAI